MSSSKKTAKKRTVEEDVQKLENELKELKKIGGRISYIEPNDIASKYVKLSTDKPVGKGDNLIIPQENLNMFIDFQVMVPKADFLFQKEGGGGVMWQSSDGFDRVEYDSVFRGTSLKYHSLNDNMLTTNYTEATYTELRKEYAKYGESEYSAENNTTLYINNVKTFDKGRECLCIRSISVKYDTSFYPTVTVEFVDVRGFSLMMPTDLAYQVQKNAAKSVSKYDGNGETVDNISVPNPTYSVYKTFFQIPNPRYLLTIKGYYGKPITYSLCLATFKCSFDSANGDFIITCKFIGYMYGIFADLPFNLLVAAPYVSTNFNQTPKSVKRNDIWKNMMSNGQLKSVTSLELDTNNNNYRNGDLMTYIEFINKMAGIKAVEENKIKTIKTSDTNRSRVESAIKNANVALGSFSKILSGGLYTECKAQNIYRQNDGRLITFVFHSKIGRKDAEINQKVLDEVKANFDELLKLYPEGNEDKYKLIDRITTVDNEDGTRIDGLGVISNIRKFRKVLDLIPDKTRMISDGMFRIQNTLLREDRSKIQTSEYNHGFIEFDVYSVDTMLAAIRSGGEVFISQQNKKLDTAKELNFLKEIGFSPCIRNFYRLFFAHMSCFMQSFWNLIKAIHEQYNLADSPRDYSKLIGGVDNNPGGKTIDRNVPKDVSDYKVAPFPAVYKVVDGKNTLIYPGDDDNEKLRNILECKFVESIYNSIVFCQGSVEALKLDAYNSNNAILAKELARVIGVGVKEAEERAKAEYEKKLADYKASTQKDTSGLPLPDDGLDDLMPDGTPINLDDFKDTGNNGNNGGAGPSNSLNVKENHMILTHWSDYLLNLDGNGGIYINPTDSTRVACYAMFFARMLSMGLHTFHSGLEYYCPAHGMTGYIYDYTGKNATPFIDNLKVNLNNPDMLDKIARATQDLVKDIITKMNAGFGGPDVCGFPIAFNCTIDENNKAVAKSGCSISTKKFENVNSDGHYFDASNIMNDCFYSIPPVICGSNLFAINRLGKKLGCHQFFTNLKRVDNYNKENNGQVCVMFETLFSLGVYNDNSPDRCTYRPITYIGSSLGNLNGKKDNYIQSSVKFGDSKDSEGYMGVAVDDDGFRTSIYLQPKQVGLPEDFTDWNTTLDNAFYSGSGSERSMEQQTRKFGFLLPRNDRANFFFTDPINYVRYTILQGFANVYGGDLYRGYGQGLIPAWSPEELGYGDRLNYKFLMETKLNGLGWGPLLGTFKKADMISVDPSKRAYSLLNFFTVNEKKFLGYGKTIKTDSLEAFKIAIKMWHKGYGSAESSDGEKKFTNGRLDICSVYFVNNFLLNMK